MSWASLPPEPELLEELHEKMDQMEKITKDVKRMKLAWDKEKIWSSVKIRNNFEWLLFLILSAISDFTSSNSFLIIPRNDANDEIPSRSRFEWLAISYTNCWLKQIEM